MHTTLRVFALLFLAIGASGLIVRATSAGQLGKPKDAPPSAGQSGNPKEALPGAKLVHKFAKEVYRSPVLVMTDKGPRLEIWFDAFDPQPPQRISGMPAPDPRVEMLLWDPIANKEVHKLSYPKEPIVFPSVQNDFGWSGWMTLSPDGKRLACKIVSYKPPQGGGVYGDFTTQVKTIDLETHKVQLGTEYKEQKAPGPLPVYITYSPDGALVMIRGSTCTIQDPGRDKPRATFEVKRAGEYKSKGYWFSIQDVAISPDSTQMAVAADGAIIVYDTTSGEKLFEAERAAPEPKKTGDLMPVRASLAYAPTPNAPQLLAVEYLGEFKTPKTTVLIRQFDLKDKKETSKQTVTERVSAVTAFFTPKGEPRVLADGKVFDGGNGKELHRFDDAAGAVISRDGKVLVRMTKKQKDSKTMTVEVWSLDN
jgi:hypothetical protein